MRPKARTLACLTAAAALNSAFATNGYFTHGIGPQSKAMAGTGVASPGFSGPAIVATNPALGAFLNEGLEVGLGAFSPRRSYRASASARFDPDGPGPAGVGTFPGPFGGGKAGVDLSQLFVTLNYAGRQSERFAWGVAPLLAAAAS